MNKSNLSRRDFIKLSGAGGLTLYFQSNFSASSAFAELSPGISSFSPIDRSLGNKAPSKFFGDEMPEKAHAVLWDKKSFLSSYNGQIPAAAERVPLVIVGGGISGLTAAYQLREHNPIILEQASAFGGNSKGQSWSGIDYSIGAAYVIKPDEGSGVEKLLKDLDLLNTCKEKGESEPFELNGKIQQHFWSGTAAPEAKEQFEKLRSYFLAVYNSEKEQFPEIPAYDDEMREYVNELDSISFRTHIEKIAGAKLHHTIETALEQYCWSSFGATMSEISAACGLNFYCAEFGDVLAFPGGNAAIAERLLSKIHSSIPHSNLRTNSLVFDVSVADDGVLVSYRDENSAIKTIHAEAVVLSIPKFVVGRVLNGIEEERLTAIRKLKYRSYLVANVLINGQIKDNFYDLYLLGDGKINSNDLVGSVREQGVTDVILANYASSPSKNTVLTLYRGFPYDGVRAEIYIPGAYERFRAEFEAQIYNSILPLLSLKKSNVEDIRIARWGHPIPLAAAGLISDGVPDKLREPFKDRVFFIEQDNWALPAFETSVEEALHWSPKINELLLK